MKRKKNIVSLLWIILCLFICTIPVQADEIPRAVFENTLNTSPDLFVTKAVESADDRYEVPVGAVFTFELKLDGKLVESKRYQVFDDQGHEIFQYEGGEQSSEDKPNKIPFQTDNYGSFTLKGGQTAKFTYVGEGKNYEVREIAQEEFVQTVPAGGNPAVGTIPIEGEEVYFKNVYIPKSEEKTTRLVLNKTISFPDGFELPDTPEFTFTLKIKGKPYGNEKYTIKEISSGTELGTGVTDENGCFTLKGDQSAAFEEIPVGVDYEITEAETEGWRTVGSTKVQGETVSPVTLAGYTNVSASFAVTKKLSDNSTPDINFNFLLTDKDKKVMAGAKYYLYTASGIRLMEDTIFETDEQGKFTLKPGQAAVFFGIDSGTVFHVSEEAHPDYIQQIPLAITGYTDRETGDTVEVLPFVNRFHEKGKSLSVTKKVENLDEQAAPADDVFTFRLFKKEGEEFVAVADAVYSILVGTSQKTFKTDAEGKFTLKANETARFETLALKQEYQIEEIDLPPGYKIEHTAQTGTLEEHLDFTFENQYEPLKADIQLLKKNNEEELLSGAVFVLYRDKELTSVVEEVGPNIDGAAISFLNLKQGIYYLVEKQSPAGYQLLSNPIKIELYEEDNHICVKVDGKEYTATDPEESIYLKRDTDGNEEVHMSIYNRKGFMVPTAGGFGIAFYGLAILSGVSMLLFGFLFKRKRKAA